MFGHVILNNVHQVKTLLKYGVSPNCQDEHGNTPLHVLAGNDRTNENDNMETWLEILRLLHYHGAHINERNTAQMTPLMIAATNGHARLVSQLVQAGSDVNLTNSEGNTALFSAVSRGHSEVVDVLLQSGRCDLKVRKQQGSGLINTVRKPYDVVENLFRNTSHAPQRTVDPMLIVASARGHNDIVNSLLNFGFDVDVVGRFQKTALHHAARCGHVETTRALLEFGAPTDCQDNMGMTPLLLAAGKGYLERYRDVMTLLIESGCDINKTDIYGRNVFHVTAAQGCADVMEILLSRGHFKAARAISFRGVTPMLSAVRSNRLQVIKVLLSFNWTVTSKFYFQNHRRPLLWFPLHDGYVDIALLLVSAGADIHALLGKSTPLCQYSAVPWLHKNILSDDKVLKDVIDLTAKPRSLTDLCRIEIRSLLSHNISREVAMLPLPPGLRDTILMKDQLAIESSQNQICL